MRISLIAVLAATLVGLVHAQAPAPAPAPTDRAESPEALLERIGRTLPPPTATIHYGADDLRSGELRLPEGRGPFPVAVLIHGGCWRADTGGRSMAGLAEMLRRRGFATWDVDYRRVGHPGGGWPGTFEDVAAGVDHLTTLARTNPLDLTRVTLIGHSSGAHLALWAASRTKLDAPWRAGEATPRFRSVVAIDGPAALAPFIGIDSQMCGQPVIVPLMGGTPAERPAEYRIASPSANLPLGLPQLLVLGELGPLMGPYAEGVRAAGDPVQTLTPPGANHFDIITPGLPNGEAVADWIVAHAVKMP